MPIGNIFLFLFFSTLTTSTYLINSAFPASVLTGSINFQDSLRMFLVLRDKEMETVLNPNAAGRADKLRMAPP